MDVKLKIDYIKYNLPSQISYCQSLTLIYISCDLYGKLLRHAAVLTVTVTVWLGTCNVVTQILKYLENQVWCWLEFLVWHLWDHNITNASGNRDHTLLLLVTYRIRNMAQLWWDRKPVSMVHLTITRPLYFLCLEKRDTIEEQEKEQKKEQKKQYKQMKPDPWCGLGPWCLSRGNTIGVC